MSDKPSKIIDLMLEISKDKPKTGDETKINNLVVDLGKSLLTFEKMLESIRIVVTQAQREFVQDKKRHEAAKTFQKAKQLIDGFKSMTSSTF